MDQHLGREAVAAAIARGPSIDWRVLRAAEWIKHRGPVGFDPVADNLDRPALQWFWRTIKIFGLIDKMKPKLRGISPPAHKAIAVGWQVVLGLGSTDRRYGEIVSPRTAPKVIISHARLSANTDPSSGSSVFLTVGTSAAHKETQR